MITQQQFDDLVESVAETREDSSLYESMCLLPIRNPRLQTKILETSIRFGVSYFEITALIDIGLELGYSIRKTEELQALEVLVKVIDRLRKIHDEIADIRRRLQPKDAADPDLRIFNALGMAEDQIVYSMSVLKTRQDAEQPKLPVMITPSVGGWCPNGHQIGQRGCALCEEMGY